MTSIDGESLELEVKHKDNGSWHPCRVSLSFNDSKYGIIVNFENSNEEDIISNREDALARLRFRSTPLQDGECSHIKEGDCVLAMYKDQFRSIFFDAVIEKPYRVKHSNRVFCRCTFEIKWLNSQLKEESSSIASKSIMKISREEIANHPIFAAFLNALGPKDGMKVPSSPPLDDETDSEVDFQGILEKQIEEISKLADGSIQLSSDLLEVKRAKLGGYKHRKGAVTSHITSNNNHNNFRRSTRSQNKKQNEVELKNEPAVDKPFLSPLAAHAAFASQLHGHDLPLKRELSFAHVEKEGQQSLVERNSKEHTKMHSLDVTNKYMKCGASSQDIIPDLWNPSNHVQDGYDDRHVKSRGVSQRSNQKGTQENTKPKESPHLEKPLQATEESDSKRWSTIVNKPIDSKKVGKLSCQSMTTRVTRSSMNKEVEILSDEVKERSSREKLICSVNTTRRTRSSVHEELEASLDEAKQGSSVEKLISTSPVNTTRLTRSRNQKEHSNPGVDQEPRKTDLILDAHVMSEESEAKKGCSPSIVNNLIDLTTGGKLSGRFMTKRVTRSSVHKETEASSNEERQESSSKKLTSNSVRPTHLRNQKEHSNAGLDQKLRETELIQDTHDTSEDVTLGKCESRKKRSISSPSNPQTESLEERNKRTRGSSCSTVTMEYTSTILEDNEKASGNENKDERKKVISSKKLPLRSSPRLNSLPRTRLQTKTKEAC